MSETAIINSPHIGNIRISRAKPTESDNGCGVKQAGSESSSVLSVCAGCGCRFVPTGPQRYCSHDCYSGTLRVPIEQRFWSKVNKFGPVPAHVPHLGPCWLFTGRARLRGYGSIAGRRNGKPWPQYAHRLSWELNVGPIPDGACVLHKCDEPLCLRPDHLFLGSLQDNLEDARQKGRLDETLPRTRTLTFEDRLTIYRASGYKGICIDLGRAYGVSKGCISQIRKGRFAGCPGKTLLKPLAARVQQFPRPLDARDRNVEPVRVVRVPVRGELHVGSVAQV